jgi:hypothetical protein
LFEESEFDDAADPAPTIKTTAIFMLKSGNSVSVNEDIYDSVEEHYEAVLETVQPMRDFTDMEISAGRGGMMLDIDRRLPSGDVRIDDTHGESTIITWIRGSEIAAFSVVGEDLD